jgi:hypothetical protein
VSALARPGEEKSTAPLSFRNSPYFFPSSGVRTFQISIAVCHFLSVFFITVTFAERV